MDIKAISRLKKIGENRYREQHGFFFEDFIVGEIYEHRPGRTITDVDNIWQSLINNNPHPVHFDYVYCKETEFGRPLVSSLVTLSIVCGLSVWTTSFNAIANLGWDKIRLVAPVFVGDTVFSESTILATRKSESRPNQGIVTIETKGKKEDGTIFMVFERSFLVPCRPE